MSKAVFKSTSRKSAAEYTVSFKPGEFVFREGDLGTEMYIVHDGKVEILKGVEGDETALAVLEKGDFFGEMALLEELPRTASARCLTDAKLVRIDGATFDQMLRDNQEIAVRMMRKFSRRLRETDQLLREAMGASAVSSAARELPQLARSEESPPASQRLFHSESGSEFFLAQGEETTIGRKDPVTGILPDIDLSVVDTQRSTSRRHARILRQGDRFLLEEEIGTMNGTFVNGERLKTGVPKQIESGAELRFGLVELTFYA